ncbi:cellulase family glycosylhydrolase [Mycolicibacterium mucogenicum]|nr:cellulase family glycosylhydrolase [Mycolicibacterium mucogenicum]
MAKRIEATKASAYIGRVGGLAVALGIGAALTSGAGTAWANEGSPGDTAGSHSSTGKTGGSASPSKAAAAGAGKAKDSDAAKRGKPRGGRHVPTAGEKAADDHSAKPAGSTSSPASTTTHDDGPRAIGGGSTPPNNDSPASPPAKSAPSAVATASGGTASTGATKPVTTPINSSSGNSPSVPSDPPADLAMLAAARRESTHSRSKANTAAAVNNTSLVSATSTTQPTAAASPTATVAPTTTPAAVVPKLPSNPAGWFQVLVYNPLHTGAQLWITSPLGAGVDAAINRLAGTYVIGNGTRGTEAAPNGTAGGWLLGNGGAGWNSTEAGVRGGNGGAAGLLGDGGIGGNGGAGAAGGIGGSGGKLMGIGGNGGAGGTLPGGTGGAGGQGGRGSGLLFGIGGRGGNGGAGLDGGRGGNGGNGAFILGIGGNGGDAGTSGVGGTTTKLPALGGAGGTAGLLGNHGAVGKYGTGSSLVQTPSGSSILSITANGMYLTNSDGQVVLLHGVNEVYKLAPYEPSASGFDEADAEFLAANGFNVVRLGVIWAGVEPTPGEYNAAYIASIQQTVNMLAAHGIYTIIDMHQDLYSASLGGEGAPEWATKTGGLPNVNAGFPASYYLSPAQTAAWDNFWNNSKASNGLGLQDNYAAAWQYVAAAFAGNNAVIGFDIMNEPFPGTSWLPTLLGSPFFAYQELTPMYRQVASAIRSVDPNAALLVEPANPAVSEVGAILGLPLQLGTIDDPNVILAFHDYCAGSATASFCGWLASQQANTAQAYAKAHQIPVIMNEFGASNAKSDLYAEMNAANANLMSWAVWAYTGYGDITTSGNTDGESLVYNPQLPPTGSNVNTSALQVLTTPFPQAISGTPIAFSNAHGTFDFSYSTAKADGSGSFAPGSQTMISVPAIAYPNGYSVTVTGGQVASAANAPVLVVTSDSAAGVIRVVVTGGS